MPSFLAVRKSRLIDKLEVILRGNEYCEKVEHCNRGPTMPHCFQKTVSRFLGLVLFYHKSRVWVSLLSQKQG